MGYDLSRRATEPELMDADDLDPSRYAEVLRDLARVNVVTRAAAPTLRWLDRVTRGQRIVSVLDVGFGQGDMLRRIARWARRRGIEATLVGVDRNPRSAPVAEALTPPSLGVTYRTGDASEIDFQPDVIISSLVAHHMGDDELVAFLQWMEATAGLGWFINDLHRHVLAFRGYRVLAALMRVDPIVRHDGALSVRRAFHRAEWADLLRRAGIRGATLEWSVPFRLCVGRIR